MAEKTPRGAGATGMGCTPFPIARSELILGGQKSGKSRRAEQLAHMWLQQSPRHTAVLIATAQAWDDEMRERIARHQRDRAERVPGLCTVEEPLHLAQAIRQHSDPHTLLVVDCLTLWLTNLTMPFAQDDLFQDSRLLENHKENTPFRQVSSKELAILLEAIDSATGPVVLVGNEIGLGVIPLGRETRAFVDALGSLNQSLATVCERVTLMAAGLPLTLKAGA